MKTVLKKAVHTIRMRLDGPTGSVREITPGTHFNCPASEVEFLTKAGAITDVQEVTAVEVVDTAPEVQNTEPAGEAKDSDGGTDESENVEKPVSLDEMTEDELLAYGDELGVKVSRRMKVETIRAKIKAHLDGEDDNADML